MTEQEMPTVLARLGGIEDRLGRLEHEVDEMRNTSAGRSARLELLIERMDNWDKRMEKHMERVESRDAAIHGALRQLNFAALGIAGGIITGLAIMTAGG